MRAKAVFWVCQVLSLLPSKKKSGVEWCTSAEEKEAACNNIGEPAWLPSPLPALIEGNPLWLRSAAALPLLSTTVIKTSAQLFATLYTQFVRNSFQLVHNSLLLVGKASASAANRHQLLLQLLITHFLWLAHISLPRLRSRMEVCNLQSLDNLLPCLWILIIPHIALRELHSYTL